MRKDGRDENTADGGLRSAHPPGWRSGIHRRIAVGTLRPPSTSVSVGIAARSGGRLAAVRHSLREAVSGLVDVTSNSGVIPVHKNYFRAGECSRCEDLSLSMRDRRNQHTSTKEHTASVKPINADLRHELSECDMSAPTAVALQPPHRQEAARPLAWLPKPCGVVSKPLSRCNPKTAGG